MEMRFARQSRLAVRRTAPHETRHWSPDELPGRRGFDLARAALGSRVEEDRFVGDFLTMDLDRLGQFDVVLFTGVLYHMEESHAIAPAGGPIDGSRRVGGGADDGDGGPRH